MGLPKDLWKFVFTGTGDHVDPRSVSLIDLLDNLDPEVSRLRAIEQLLKCMTDELDAETLQGVGNLIGDIRRRISVMLHAAATSEARPEPQHRPKPQ